MTAIDATALAHRAIVAASVLGLKKATRGLRVSVAEMSAAATAASADLLVVTDEGRVAVDHIRATMAAARAAIGDAGVLALVVGSPVTRALVAAAGADVVAAMEGRDDAYARAIMWASARARQLAPALDPERLKAIVEAAVAADLTLVEPELAATAPALGRLRGFRSPRARALLATVAQGAGARPLLFVPSRTAPKGGLARAKLERLADGWVRAEPSSQVPPAATDVARAALAILRGAAGPLPFKDLLREARERWTTHVRATGGRATPSSADALDLATALHHLAADDDVTLFALDPSNPCWELVVL
jgi:hypothetical protein